MGGREVTQLFIKALKVTSTDLVSLKSTDTIEFKIEKASNVYYLSIAP